MHQIKLTSFLYHQDPAYIAMPVNSSDKHIFSEYVSYDINSGMIEDQIMLDLDEEQYKDIVTRHYQLDPYSEIWDRAISYVGKAHPELLDGSYHFKLNDIFYIYEDGICIYKHEPITSENSTAQYGIPLNVLGEQLQRFSKEEYESGLNYIEDASGRVRVGSLIYQLCQKDQSEARMEQYLSLLRADALSKGVSAATIDYHINGWKHFLKNDPSRKAVHQSLHDIMNDDLHKGIPCIMPLMCGSGKSTAISYLMKEILENIKNGKSTDGLLIVTDEIDRFDEYTNASFDKDLSVFFSSMEDHIIKISQSNLWEAKRKQKHAPIIMMTTQRYRNLTVQEINKFLVWDKGSRPYVIIDELIDLVEQTDVSRKKAWEIAGIIDECIPVHNEKDREEKNWLMEQWHKLCCRYSEYVKQNEDTIIAAKKQQKTNDIIPIKWYPGSETHTMTDDDDRFMKDINAHADTLQQCKEGIIRDIQAFQKVETEGGVFWQVQTEEYQQHTISVAYDISNIISDINAQVIILDGTGNLHPSYDGIEKYIYPSNAFARRLDNLHIHIIYEKTNKTYMIREKNDIVLKRALDNLRKIQMVQPKHCAAFTYKAIEGKCKRYFKAVAHFGNIKGSNKLRNLSAIVQLGLNVYPSSYYFMYAAAKDTHLLQELISYSENNNLDEYIHNYVNSNEALKDIHDRMILSDIEQNLFRSAIRTPSFIDEVHYYLYFDTDKYVELIKQIQERYSSLGAHIDLQLPPKNRTLFNAERRGGSDKLSCVEAIVKWHDALPNGTEYTKADIALQLYTQKLIKKNSTQYVHSLLEKHPTLEKLIDQEGDKLQRHRKYIKSILHIALADGRFCEAKQPECGA